ncbi:MAG TPA: 50S ribosomal protein L21 [Candidatus Polarisedimenticolia bacterium]|jgi:large subunit ribosomal protein L21|nr:50S ribosomal protein L21 [Candidatus Polarisedimenticolia bacterium]
MYAIIRSGGKQHKVSKGDILKIEKIDKKIGEKVEFEEVLLVGGDKAGMKVGQPVVADAKVVATVVQEGRTKKVLVFKKKRRKQYRRTQGHRQSYTAVKVEDIIA